jgi:hypothetical protein
MIMLRGNLTAKWTDTGPCPLERDINSLVLPWVSIERRTSRID